MTTYAMPKIGDVVAEKYRLEGVAGEGGMGIVYAAEHLVLRQRVAVKVLLPSAATSDAVVERFAREAQAAARIQSEHVARVMDAGSLASGAPFLVMEYLEGLDFEELLKVHKTVSVTEAADYALQALEALGFAHAVGIVHRDLKPANLFLARRPDGTNVVKMLDFGISKAMKARPEEKVLTGQAVLGSPVYMSPEQLRNAKETDPRADLWSLGVVLYELVAGRPPFDGDGVGEIFAAILEKDPTPLHVLDPRVPPAFSAIVTKCLARKVEDRWTDAGALARAMQKFGSGAWSDVVPRVEQVLLRALRMSVPSTPTEVRRVEMAIAEAAERALSTGHGTEPVLLTKRKDDAHHAGLRMRMAAFAGRTSASRWVGLGACVFVLVATIAAFAAVRTPKVVASVAPRAGLGEITSADAPAAATDVTGATSDGTAGAGADGRDVDPASAGGAKGDVPAAVDLPETSAPKSSAQRGRGTKAGKPQRPKFLNSRE